MQHDSNQCIFLPFIMITQIFIFIYFLHCTKWLCTFVDLSLLDHTKNNFKLKYCFSHVKTYHCSSYIFFYVKIVRWPYFSIFCLFYSSCHCCLFFFLHLYHDYHPCWSIYLSYCLSSMHVLLSSVTECIQMIKHNSIQSWHVWFLYFDVRILFLSHINVFLNGKQMLKFILHLVC